MLRDSRLANERHEISNVLFFMYFTMYGVYYVRGSGLNSGNGTILYAVMEMSCLFHTHISQTALRIVPFPEFNPESSSSIQHTHPPPTKKHIETPGGEYRRGGGGSKIFAQFL